MRIYDLLLNNRRPHLISPSREYIFFQEHENALSHYPDVLPFVNVRDEFRLISINIVIEAILNFNALQTYFTEHKTTVVGDEIKPLFMFNEIPIYCPLFSVSNNLLIANGHGAKLSLTNDAIDLFETYNFALFDSNLTSLVHVGGDKQTKAYYHYDFHTIYIINNQGRLDVRISLFDRFITKPDFRNVLERIKPVISAYYTGNQTAFIQSLHKEKLISTHLYSRYIQKHRKRQLHG